LFALTTPGSARQPLFHAETASGVLGPNPDMVVLSGNWKYQLGDNPDWAKPDLDDSNWPTGDSWFANTGVPDGWDGRGWFRFRLTIDPTLIGETLAMVIIQLGAIEVYVDGELAHSVGVIGETEGDRVDAHHHTVPAVHPIVFDRDTEHLIAVRVAEYDGPFRTTVGFKLGLSEPGLAGRNIAEYVQRDLGHRLVVGAAALTIALMHLLLFAFYPKMAVNLYYGLFTFLAFALAVIPIWVNRTTDMLRLEFLMRAFMIVMFLISLMGIRFLYSVFYTRLPRMFWAWFAATVAGIILFRAGPIVAAGVFVLICFVEIIRVIVVGLIRKVPYAHLLAIGVLAFIGASAYQIVFEMFYVRPTHDYVYLHGMLVMLIFMSVGLARGFGETNRLLEEQIRQVKDLSDHALEQERRAKKQEMERLQLEADNVLKAQELQEAHKRQKVLDQLAETNQELRQTQSQLVQSEKMAALGSLVAGVAHEINTPVGAITSMHNTLVKAVDKLKVSVREVAPDEFDNSPKIQRPLKIIDDANSVIESGSLRVTNIVKRLRSFARLDEAELKTVNIHDGIEDTLTIVHHQLKHHVTVKKNYGKIPEIAVYPGQLNQVFLNILVNGGQAIEGQGEITITTALVGDKVHITFVDTGKGIPTENLERIFDPGFTTKGVGVGTGLGLSICYRIIQDHKGEIRAESAAGKGTTFTIILPTDLEERAANDNNTNKGD
jgi:signal transduction histidine kinase